MPILIGGVLIFLPGESALFKPDEQHEGEPCIVTGLVPDKNNELSAYKITLEKSKKTMFCACEQLCPRPQK